MSDLRAVVLSATRIDGLATNNASPPSGKPSALFALLVLAGEAGMTKATATATLSCLGDGIEAVASRLRTWLRGFGEFRLEGENERLVLRTPPGFDTDWAEFDRRRRAASGYGRLAPHSSGLLTCWAEMSAALDLLPNSPATSVLPALTEYQDTGLVAIYHLAVVKAHCDRARIGLQLGRFEEVDERLEPIFHMNRLDHDVAELLAQAKFGRERDSAALKVIFEHESAIDKELGIGLPRPLVSLRNHIRRPRARTQTAEQSTPDTFSGATNVGQSRLSNPLANQRWTLNTSIPEGLLGSHQSGDTHEHNAGFAGDWFQLTYELDDIELASRPCSIELVDATESRDRLRGSFTRLWRDNLRRTWSFEARSRGAMVIGDYQPESDSAGLPGIFQLSQHTCCLCEGWFISTTQRNWNRAVSHEFDAPARLIWIRGIAPIQTLVRPYLEEVKQAMAREHRSRILEKVAHLVIGEHEGPDDTSPWEQFCFGGSHVDSTAALAVQRHRRQRSAQPSDEPSRPNRDA